jgi:hypothetical protein
MKREDAHISIFGGKLTDCLNVGNEVSELVRSLGVTLPYPNYKWYGEPPDTVREEFFHQARLPVSMTTPHLNLNIGAHANGRY